jgi:threonine aldolase
MNLPMKRISRATHRLKTNKCKTISTTTNNENIIDFRSDTVTKPTNEMRNAMANAVVGDDVFGDDPTVKLLEERSAALLGKEAAIFTPSGVMANQIALGIHCSRPGTATICGTKSHIYCYETGGASQLWGITLDTIENEKNGQLSIPNIKAHIREIDPHQPLTTTIALEQTQNKCGGTTLGDSIGEVSSYMNKVKDVCDQYGFKFHVDGARILNAAVKLSVSPKELVLPCDTVSMCLSKGVGAPVGSILAGSCEMIEEGRRMRKLLGGGLRQSGVLCAAALVGLDLYQEQFTSDHSNAFKLANALNDIDGFHIDIDMVQTNLVFVDISKDCVDVNFLKEELYTKYNISIAGDKYGGMHPTIQNVRFVTHRGISNNDIDYFIENINKILSM